MPMGLGGIGKMDRIELRADLRFPGPTWAGGMIKGETVSVWNATLEWIRMAFPPCYLLGLLLSVPGDGAFYPDCSEGPGESWGTSRSIVRTFPIRAVLTARENGDMNPSRNRIQRCPCG